MARSFVDIKAMTIASSFLEVIGFGKLGCGENVFFVLVNGKLLTVVTKISLIQSDHVISKSIEVLEGDIDVTVGMDVLDIDVLGVESIVGRVVILLDHHVLEVACERLLRLVGTTAGDESWKRVVFLVAGIS